MKKLLKRICAAFLAAATVFCFASCGKGVVKDGSKIEKMTVTLEYTDTDDKAQTLKVEIELYMNYAPATIDHVKYLASKGYYNGTIVSDLKTNHIEFGDFYLDNGERKSRYDENAKLAYTSIINSDYVSGKTIANGKRNRYTATGSIVGEFRANGISSSKTLTVSDGTLVLKRDTLTYDSDGGHDTAKGTLALVTGSDSYYTNVESGYTAAQCFAVIGKITKGKDTLKKLITDADKYVKDTNGSTTYYFDYENCVDKNDKDSETLYEQFESLGHLFVKDSEGKYTAVGGETPIEITSDDYSDVLSKLNGNSKYLRAVPYKTITIKSVSLSK
mgnify:FL=1